jgi:hypothetical protein
MTVVVDMDEYVHLPEEVLQWHSIESSGYRRIIRRVGRVHNYQSGHKVLHRKVMVPTDKWNQT